MPLLFIFSFSQVFSQQKQGIVSGPMIGHTDQRSTVLWLEASGSKSFRLKLSPSKTGHQIGQVIDSSNGNYIIRFNIGGLEPGTAYRYELLGKGTGALASGSFSTQSLWQYRRPAPDFSFLTGSCAYFNEPVYDRPGKPYGSDSVIFSAMAKEKADFMLWLGDNWYLREVDFYSEWGVHYRPSRDRATKVLQPLLRAMPHYATWDDHDYGWNNADKSYPLKTTAREVFKKYWTNPSYGQEGEGIYTKFTWNDIDVFMLDSRWFRSNDEMADSVGGQPNADKRMFGKKQMEWLKNALLESRYNGNISFRLIATGSQVLNPLSTKDCLVHYPVEYAELMAFLDQYNINGVIFLTGDRHHSEVIKRERKGRYPLYDITSSSLTAGIARTYGDEKNNPDRVSMEVTEHNYSRISVTGPKDQRKLTVEFMNIKGEKITEWSVLLKDVSGNKQ